MNLLDGACDVDVLIVCALGTQDIYFVTGAITWSIPGSGRATGQVCGMNSMKD
jgi:hypothetical protein